MIVAFIFLFDFVLVELFLLFGSVFVERSCAAKRVVEDVLSVSKLRFERTGSSDGV